MTTPEQKSKNIRYGKKWRIENPDKVKAYEKRQVQKRHQRYRITKAWGELYRLEGNNETFSDFKKRKQIELDIKEDFEKNFKRTKLHDLIEDFIQGHDEVNEKAEDIFEKFLQWFNIKKEESN